MADKPKKKQVFGYRSFLYRFLMTLCIWILVFYFLGPYALFMAVITSFYFNLAAMDTMRVTIDDELIHVTRYIPIAKYDNKFWLKDIKEIGLYKKMKFGKTRNRWVE